MRINDTVWLGLRTGIDAMQTNSTQNTVVCYFYTIKWHQAERCKRIMFVTIAISHLKTHPTFELAKASLFYLSGTCRYTIVVHGDYLPIPGVLSLWGTVQHAQERTLHSKNVLSLRPAWIESPVFGCSEWDFVLGFSRLAVSATQPPKCPSHCIIFVQFDSPERWLQLHHQLLSDHMITPVSAAVASSRHASVVFSLTDTRTHPGTDYVMSPSLSTVFSCHQTCIDAHCMIQMVPQTL